MSALPVQQVNLYQPMFRQRRVVLPARSMAILLLLVVAVLGTVHGYRWWRMQPLEAAVAGGEAAIGEGEARLAALASQYPARLPSAALAQQLTRQQATLAQTREIARRLASGAYGSPTGLSGYLEGFARQHQDGTWLTEVRIAAGGNALGLTGRSLMPELVPAYLARLGHEALFKGKTFSELELVRDTGGLDEIAFSVRTQGLAAEDDS